MNVVIVKNSNDDAINGEYIYKKTDNVDANTLSFYKDEEHRIYRYNGIWRIANIGKNIHIELNECKHKNWDINILDVKIYENSINEIDIRKFLLKYNDQEIVYVPNPGNAGDSIIAYGTIQLLNELGLNWKMGNINTTYMNKIIFYGGGGNFVELYGSCRIFISKNCNNNKIILLPHTINSNTDLLKNLDNNVIIICREKISYAHVHGIVKHKENVYLSKDMAFYIKNIDKYKNITGSGTCNCFRTDNEKTMITIPNDNVDLSFTLLKVGCTSNMEMIENVSLSIFEYLSKYDTVNTNRLHMCIAGCLLNKKVNFYPNSYYKNKAVYDYSIKTDFAKCKFNDVQK